MGKQFPSQHDLLFKKGISDLTLALRGYELHDEHIDTATLLFHLQQAAEKFIKAILAFNGIHFEKIHDLNELIKLCKENAITLPEFTIVLPDLNPFAIMGRYDIFDDEDFEFDRYCNLIRQLADFTKSILYV